MQATYHNLTCNAYIGPLTTDQFYRYNDIDYGTSAWSNRSVHNIWAYQNHICDHVYFFRNCVA